MKVVALVVPGAIALTMIVAAWVAIGAWPLAALNTEADVSSLIIESAGISANEQVTVKLTADATSPGIGVATVDIEYDSGLIEAVSCTAALTLCSIDVIAPDTVRFVAISAGGLTGSGVVLGSATFQAGPYGGVAALTINRETLQIVNPSGEELPITPTDGSITIAGPSPPVTPTPTGGGSPTGTATATATADGTASASASASAPVSATATPAPVSTVWGDANCSGGVDPVDSLFTLRFDAGLGINTGGCPEMGAEVEVLSASPHVWGDVDCGGEITPVDSLKLLRFDAGLDVAQGQGCPGMGTSVTVVAG